MYADHVGHLTSTNSRTSLFNTCTSALKREPFVIVKSTARQVAVLTRLQQSAYPRLPSPVKNAYYGGCPSLLLLTMLHLLLLLLLRLAS